jgi:hypothetical protein
MPCEKIFQNPWCVSIKNLRRSIFQNALQNDKVLFFESQKSTSGRDLFQMKTISSCFPILQKKDSCFETKTTSKCPIQKTDLRMQNYFPFSSKYLSPFKRFYANRFPKASHSKSSFAKPDALMHEKH